MRALFIVVRVAGAVLGVVAMVNQLILTDSYWAEQGVEHRGNAFINFFSFFTIDSNVGAVIVFAVGAALLIRGVPDPRWFALLRVSVVAYMTVTFLVYNLLLRGIALPQGVTLPWSNEVLHVIAPLAIILDWFFAPGRTEMRWKDVWVIVAFPIVWVIYTLVRGPLAQNDLTGKPTWYPYPFLDPALSSGGYWSVLLYVVVIAAAFVVVGMGAIWISHRKARWPLAAAR